MNDLYSNVQFSANLPSQNTPIIDDQLQSNSNDQISKNGFNLGFIVIIFFAIILLIFGVIFFTQNSKVSANDLPALENNPDYTLNPVYLILTTLNWKEQDYQGLTIKYPPGWKVRSYDLGKGELVSLSKVEDGKGSAIFLGEISRLTDKTCDQYLENEKKRADTANTASNNQNQNTASFAKEGIIRINKYSTRAVLLFENFQGYTAKSLTLCLQKDGRDYAMQLMEQDAEKKLRKLKDFILILNSIKL
ncbi:hypothetical protein HYU95_01885 [Candidatus Daviesbacteria bacterium]|nr:hypothetical protein [Candidatus Daviesbacteria bacterium]